MKGKEDLAFLTRFISFLGTKQPYLPSNILANSAVKDINKLILCEKLDYVRSRAIGRSIIDAISVMCAALQRARAPPFLLDFSIKIKKFTEVHR